MITINGMDFDGWIRNKFGGKVQKEKGGMKKWIVNGSPAIQLPIYPCEKVMQDIKEKEKNRRVITAIDGTEYIVFCGGLSSGTTNPLPPSVSVSASATSLKVGEYLFITVVIEGNAVWKGIDNYGQEYETSKTKIYTVRMTDEWDTYVLVWNACDGSRSIGTGAIEVSVQPNTALSFSTTDKTREIFINKCTTSQAVAISSLLGQTISVSDGEVSFTGILVSIDLRYVADDMSDVDTKRLQGVDIYTGTLEVELT
jgi:hypothetical protein